LSTSVFTVVTVSVSDPQVRMGRIRVTSTRTSWYGWASSVELSKSQFKWATTVFLSSKKSKPFWETYLPVRGPC